MANLYCIGDSHVCLFSGYNKILPVMKQHTCVKDSKIKVFHIGPALAFSLNSKKSGTNSKSKVFGLLKKNIPKNSYVLFCFGEIDCRAHLLRQCYLKDKTQEEVSQICVGHYLEFVLEAVKLGFHPIIYNAIPSSWRNRSTTSYPTFGSTSERNTVTQIFNRALRSACEEKNILFLDTYHLFVDKKNRTLPEYYYDSIHLSQRAFEPTIERVHQLITSSSLNLSISCKSPHNSREWNYLLGRGLPRLAFSYFYYYLFLFYRHYLSRP